MSPNRRILLIDDMPAIHADFRKILVAGTAASALDDAEAALFGTAPATSPEAGFQLDSAYQGSEGVAMVGQALDAGQPYALAFVDMRMAPGWDGVETVERLWQKDPRVQVVICTAYSDYAWADVLARLEARDRLLVLKKPFDIIEVTQLAATLTAKWDMARQAELALGSLRGRLVQSEKLAAVGLLAAGVAHEINNPLGFIFSNFATLNTYLDDMFEMLAAYEDAEASIGSADIAARLQATRERIELAFLKEDIPQLMKESMGGVNRVSKIVQDLKDFSRIDSDQEWSWADLHQGIDSTLNIVASEVRYKADVVREYGSLPEVECLPSQLNQVFMNLVVNAAHAIGPERGRIAIRTGAGNDEVWIEVADTGAGIPEDVLPHIFDPFFTTKPVGKGTGLGLSLSYGIVQKHNGRIDVATQLGKGTTFRVVLPVRRAAQ